MEVAPPISKRPLTREDLCLSETSFNGSQSSHRMYDDLFRQRHDTDMADLRFQLLEHQQSQRKDNTIVSTSAVTVAPATSPR